VRDRFLGAAGSDCGGRVSLQIKSLVLARETKSVDLTNLAGVNSLSD
jgi:hypothetical protein